MASICPKELVVDSLKSILGRYQADLAFLTDEQALASPMGSARSAIAFTAECIGFNALLGEMLLGKEVSFPDEATQSAFTASFTSIASVSAALAESTEKLIDIVGSLDDAQIVSTIVAPWGQSYPAWKLALLASDHMGYHDGQINYIQTLFNDVQNHWH